MYHDLYGLFHPPPPPVIPPPIPSRSWFPLALFLTVWAVNLAAQDVTQPETPSGPALTVVEPGDWGHLEYYPLVLEPPADYLRSSPYWKSHLTGTEWSFHQQSLDEVRRALTDAGLSPEAVDRLLATAVVGPETGRIVIQPPEDVILALDPVARERLYNRIGPPDGPNPFSEPFGIDPRGFRVMAEGSRLSPESIDLISSLTFSRSKVKLFSDIALVSARQATEADRLILFGTLLRQPSTVMRLRLGPESDLPTIADYWAAGGRNEGIRPLLQSMAASSAVDTIDVIHLLPPTPRKLLNTFPSPMMSLGQSFPDCFWTAMNFFNDEPSDRYLDSQWLGDWLEEDYETVQKPLRLGDVIVFIKTDDNKPLHACNYLAGDLIFTKNGLSLMKPWTVQTIDDVLGTYLTEERVTVSFFRKRL